MKAMHPYMKVTQVFIFVTLHVWQTHLRDNIMIDETWYEIIIIVLKNLHIHAACCHYYRYWVCGKCLYVHSQNFLVPESAIQRLKAPIQKVLPSSKWKSSKINIELCRSCVWCTALQEGVGYAVVAIVLLWGHVIKEFHFQKVTVGLTKHVVKVQAALPDQFEWEF